MSHEEKVNYRDNYGDRLEKCYSGAVYDTLRAMGFPDQLLPQTIRPLDPARILAGRVFTVSGHVDLALDPHTTLLEWTKLLSRAPGGSVVVCQPNDSTLAHMGELSSETFSYRGVSGYFTPRDVVGRWVADGFGEPIVIGGVRIRTGDYVMADRDGVVIIPQEIIAEVTDRVEVVLRTENKVRTAILKGVDPVDAYLQYRKF